MRAVKPWLLLDRTSRCLGTAASTMPRWTASRCRTMALISAIPWKYCTTFLTLKGYLVSCQENEAGCAVPSIPVLRAGQPVVVAPLCQVCERCATRTDNGTISLSEAVDHARNCGGRLLSAGTIRTRSGEAGAPSGWVPLSFYRRHSCYTMCTYALDRFGTHLEQRFTKDQIRSMMQEAGLCDISLSDSEPFWCAVGYCRA